jgi:dethiobiotin synthetase
LSIDYLKRHGFKIHSLVFNGDFEDEVKQAIIGDLSIKTTEIPTIQSMSKNAILQTASAIKL